MYRPCRSADAFVSLEQGVASHLSDPREPRNVVPECNQQDPYANLIQAGTESFNLSALAGTVNAREAYKSGVPVLGGFLDHAAACSFRALARRLVRPAGTGTG